MRGPTRRVAGFDDRSLSDLIAFILMFSIIITGVGIVSLGAFGNLTEFSDREKIENGERGLTAMASTLDDMHRQNDRYRSELKLAPGGSSVYLENSSLNITIRDNGTSVPVPGFGPTDPKGNKRLNAIEQRFDRNPDDEVVSYEGGGVFRRPGYDARYRPSLQCGTDLAGTDLAIVSVVTIQPDNFRISNGSDSRFTLNPRALPGESPVADLGSTLLFDARWVSQNRTYLDNSEYDVYLNVSETNNREQWTNYFENSPEKWEPTSEKWEPTSDKGVCRGVDAVLIRQTVVKLSI